MEGGRKVNDMYARDKIMNNGHDKFTRFSSNNIINQSTHNKQKEGVSDAIYTSHYLQYDEP